MNFSSIYRDLAIVKVFSLYCNLEKITTIAGSSYYFPYELLWLYQLSHHPLSKIKSISSMDSSRNPYELVVTSRLLKWIWSLWDTTEWWLDLHDDMTRWCSICKCQHLARTRRRSYHDRACGSSTFYSQGWFRRSRRKHQTHLDHDFWFRRNTRKSSTDYQSCEWRELRSTGSMSCHIITTFIFTL